MKSLNKSFLTLFVIFSMVFHMSAFGKSVEEYQLSTENKKNVFFPLNNKSLLFGVGAGAASFLAYLIIKNYFRTPKL